MVYLFFLVLQVCLSSITNLIILTDRLNYVCIYHVHYILKYISTME
jgi:hypothetical protein